MAVSKLSVGQAVKNLVENADWLTGWYTEALVTCETADVRYYVDGTNPSGTDGHLLYTTGMLQLSDPNDIRHCKFYCPAGTATLQVTLKRRGAH